MRLIVIEGHEPEADLLPGESVVVVTRAELRAWVAAQIASEEGVIHNDPALVLLQRGARRLHAAGDTLLAAAVLHLARAHEHGYLTEAVESLLQTAEDVEDVADIIPMAAALSGIAPPAPPAPERRPGDVDQIDCLLRLWGWPEQLGAWLRIKSDLARIEPALRGPAKPASPASPEPDTDRGQIA